MHMAKKETDRLEGDIVSHGSGPKAYLNTGRYGKEEGE